MALASPAPILTGSYLSATLSFRLVAVKDEKGKSTLPVSGI